MDAFRTIAGVTLLVCACRAPDLAAPRAFIPRDAQLGPETTPSFSDWDVVPIAFNEVVVVAPDPDCGAGCLAVGHRSGYRGGSYGIDANGDGARDATLTADVELRSTVHQKSDGTFHYEWSLTNFGSGAVTEFLGPFNGPEFPISAITPLLGTAGADRLPGTSDDLLPGQNLLISLTHTNAPEAKTWRISFNPTTPNGADLFRPTPFYPASEADCKDGGWQGLRFRDQGQCLRYVQTGKDDRDGQ